MDAFTPQQTVELISRIGTKKAHMRMDKLFFSSAAAGALLGFGCAVLLSTTTAPWFTTNAPGLIRTIGALIFPVGLVMIVLTGSDLVTSNMMFMTTAFLHRRVTIIDLLLNWTISFLGNLAGSLFFMAIIIGYGGELSSVAAYKSTTTTFAHTKIVVPEWHQIFLRGIGCNWLVCLAVFLSISSREVSSKIIAIWFPTATFVALGMDHVVANMFFIPLGIFNGAPIGVGYYIWKSMIPSAIGNIVGGGLFVGALYWYLYLTGEDSVDVSFNIGGPATALSAGGPLGSERTSDGRIIYGEERRDGAMETIASPGRGGQVHGDMLPHSGGVLHSSVGKELSAEKYAKRKGSDESEGTTV